MGRRCKGSFSRRANLTEENIFCVQKTKFQVWHTHRAPRGYGERGNLPFSLMGTWANFSRELGNKVNSGEQFGIFLREQSKTIFGNKGDFANFSREHRNTDLLWGLTQGQQ